ncbi:hypothetical protein PF010_g2540 [Phytophthora fragariae]|uniref:Uncharacterized protein n=1 Tax=Phytophthora fragariae TaxID=53985 RepID=A0A6G0P3W6_9STRA|nr:hypothetical protein PF010_g2540 [Phytophthora fragariae]KAE9234281.1 hypothetical protein PF004_g9425 [Phytophthora fragariae]
MLHEFKVQQPYATLFVSLERFNVSVTTNLACSDSKTLYHYVQYTLPCLLSDEAFNRKFGINDTSSTNRSEIKREYWKNMNARGATWNRSQANRPPFIKSILQTCIRAAMTKMKREIKYPNGLKNNEQ